MKLSQHRKRHLWNGLALASLLWLGVGQGDTPEIVHVTAEAQAKTLRKQTAAYVFDRPNLKFSDADAQSLSQLNFSFALIKNGVVNGDHWQSINTFSAFVSKYPHILPVLSVGGWAADGFSQAAATAEGRTLFVKSTLALMEKHGFLGVDIDWEYPGSKAAGIASSPNDRETFTLLLRELRDSLDALTMVDGKPRLLAIALGADPVLIKNIDSKAVGEIVDQVNLMTYDLQSPNIASHHTPLYSSSDRFPLSADNAVRAFSEAGIPRKKLMLGCAFYGRVYKMQTTNSVPVFSAAKDNGAKTINYKGILSQKRWVHAFDDNAKASYATDGSLFMTYDSPESIAHKGAYVIDNDLMGLMCWEYGGDADGKLLAAMHQSLIRK